MSIPPVFSTLLRALALASAACALAAPTPSLGQGTVLYDINFINGRPPGITTVFGSPTVVSQFGPITDGAMLFLGRERYDQIELRNSSSATSYRIDFEVVTENLNNSLFSFSAILDTPEVRTLDLHGYSDVYTFPYSASTRRTSWNDGERVRFTMAIDFTANRWQVWKDGIQIRDSELNGTQFRSLRFSLAPWYANTPSNLSIKVALDNIRIVALDDAQPVAPGSLSASRDQTDGVELSWPAVPDALAYRVYRSEGSNFATATYLTSTTDPVFLDDTLEPSWKPYHYWVTSSTPSYESAPSPMARGLFPIDAWPDLSLSARSAGVRPIGVGIINASGEGQTATTAGRGAKPVEGEILLWFVGSVRDDVRIEGPSGDRQFTVRYRATSWGNITAEMATGRFVVPASRWTSRVYFTISKNPTLSLPRRPFAMSIRAKLVNNPSRRDAVILNHLNRPDGSTTWVRPDSDDRR